MTTTPQLLNMLIGLCNNEVGWPTTLHDMGYAVLLIEEKVRVDHRAAVIPDLVAYSGRHSHAIVAECKSGHTIPPHQDGSYAALSTSDLKPWIANADSKRTGHVACYVVNQRNHAKLVGQTRLPFIVFGDAVKGYGKFGRAALDRALHAGVPIKGLLAPAGYYPFSDSDDIRVIVRHTLQGLVSLVRNPVSAPLFDLGNPDTARHVLAIVEDTSL